MAEMHQDTSANGENVLEAIIAAEMLLGITFTESERKLIAEDLHKDTTSYERLRRTTLANDVLLPLYFDPRVPPTSPTPPSRVGRSERQPPPVEKPRDPEQLAFYTVTQLADLIRTRQVSSVELTEIYIERLKRYGRTLECVITLTDDLAMRQAKRADEEIAHGHYRGPLHGIPWGAKDLLATRGIPTTWGALPFKDQVLDFDATIVQRLEEAGAVLVAKLSMGALAHGDVWFGGKTKNPWNTQESSGGSSAGPAAATAAGLVGFAIGSETTGSIVWPALRCGVSGLRPTFGRVSRYGAMILSWSLDKLGPICRSVEDCALVLSAICGVDPNDPYTIDAPFEWPLDGDLSTLRVGYVKSAFEEDRDTKTYGSQVLKELRKQGVDLREHKPNDDRTLQTLRSLGINLIPIELPDFDLEPLLIILYAEGAAAFDDITRNKQIDLLTGSDPHPLAKRMRQARLIPAVEYIQANRVRMQVMQAMAEVMKEVDVFLVPQLGANNLTLTNLTGQPTVGVPNGFTDRGMPTGINVVGGLFRDAEVLALGRAYQDATNYHRQHPITK